MKGFTHCQAAVTLFGPDLGLLSCASSIPRNPTGILIGVRLFLRFFFCLFERVEEAWGGGREGSYKAILLGHTHNSITKITVSCLIQPL